MTFDRLRWMGKVCLCPATAIVGLCERAQVHYSQAFGTDEVASMLVSLPLLPSGVGRLCTCSGRLSGHRLCGLWIGGIQAFGLVQDRNETCK